MEHVDYLTDNAWQITSVFLLWKTEEKNTPVLLFTLSLRMKKGRTQVIDKPAAPLRIMDESSVNQVARIKVECTEDRSSVKTMLRFGEISLERTVLPFGGKFHRQHNRG